MKENIKEIRNKITGLIPKKWKNSRHLKQLSTKITEPYDFRFQIRSEEIQIIHSIRCAIINYPWCVSTRPVRINTTEKDDKFSEVHVSLIIFGHRKGFELEKKISENFGLILL